ncbi:MAG: hypothetical protein OSJ54_12370 [Oscillospiraceae bacterium]|nr:hypothetical protein [Oscillospiraceae bacterium]
MSCSFWIRRKRSAAKKAAEIAEQAEKAETAVAGEEAEIVEQAESLAPPKEKAGKKNADKRTGRKPKVERTAD